ncbi:hypothetical protein AAC387_Pa11g0293 [Persea americana]
MGKKRRLIASSEDEDEERLPPPSSSTSTKKKRREEEEDRASERNKKNKKGRGNEDEDEEEEEEAVQEDAKPVGDIIKTSGKGKGKKNHYASFEYDGNHFELEDPVLLTPEEKGQKPYVAIIKDITQAKDGSMSVTGQWFYRPEEAEKRGGGSWEARDTRELFYSFHRDEVPAESVMHKCVVHFVPLNKQLPRRQQHPGFIVQKVYDTVERKLWKLTDKDYEDSKQHEIDLLVMHTIEQIGELPDIESEDASPDPDDQLKLKRLIRRKNMAPIDVSRDDDATTRSDQLIRSETPGSCTSETSEFYTILANFKALTGDMHRDKWLEKLLQGIQFVCNSLENTETDDKENGGTTQVDQSTTRNKETVDESLEKSPNDGGNLCWPDDAVPAVTALEKASHDALGSDFQKYNQKMRQLYFNLKKNALLARRLLNKELEPSVILNMSPNELKDGLTAEEKSTKEPEELQSLQMTDARCSRCTEKKVGVADIIQAGGSGCGDRYQLQCIACGNTWYASRDEISSLTIDASSVVGNVGTAPWATAKFDAVEKKLVSPRDSEKPAADHFQKSTAAYMPVLETQKSFNKPRTEDPSASADKIE